MSEITQGNTGLAQIIRDRACAVLSQKRSKTEEIIFGADKKMAQWK